MISEGRGEAPALRRARKAAVSMYVHAHIYMLQAAHRTGQDDFSLRARRRGEGHIIYTIIMMEPCMSVCTYTRGYLCEQGHLRGIRNGENAVKIQFLKGKKKHFCKQVGPHKRAFCMYLILYKINITCFPLPSPLTLPGRLHNK